MLKVDKPRRFPYSKIVRRLNAVVDELAEWKVFYQQQLQIADSPVLRERLHQRIESIDSTWHDLAEARFAFANDRAFW